MISPVKYLNIESAINGVPECKHSMPMMELAARNRHFTLDFRQNLCRALIEIGNLEYGLNYRM